MEITVIYSVELNEEDVQKIEKLLNKSPSLTTYASMEDYLKDRLKGAVRAELRQDHEEKLSIKSSEKYFQLHLRLKQ